MKVLHFGGCILVTLGAALAFGLSAAIGSNTHASETPVWTETCTIHRLRSEAELLCNSYSAAIPVDSKVLAAMSPKLETCRAYRTHWERLDIECEEIPVSE